jgi:chemotaxis protein histidine kinase CheA
MPSDLLEEFVFDSREHLTNASNQLLSLEKNPESLDNLNALMGTLHTIKGNSGFVNQRHLYELLHSAESLLQTVRDNTERGCPAEVVEVLFQVLDTSEAIMSRLEHDEDDEVDWLPSLLDAIKESAASLEWQEANKNNQAGERGEAPSEYQAEEETPEEPSSEEPSQEETPEEKGEDEAMGVSPENDLLGEPEPLATPAGPSDEPAGEGADEEVPTILNPMETIQYLKLEDGDLGEKGENYLLDSMILQYHGNGGEGLILDLRDLKYLASPEARYLEQLSVIWSDRMAVVLSREDQRDLLRVFTVLDLQGAVRFYPGTEEARAALEQKAR